MKKTVIAGAFMLASASASAAGFNYNYLELGYGDIDHGDAIFFGGSAQIQRGLDLVGSYYDLDFDGPASGSIFTAGVQFNTPIGPKTDFVGSVQLIKAEWEVEYRYNHRTRSVSDDDTGLMLRGGVRHAIQSNILLEGDISYISNDFWDNNELGLKADVRFYATRQFSVAAGVASDQELDGIFVSGRFDL